MTMSVMDSCSKRCLVCGESHYARRRHGRGEVSEAIERLKGKHPTVLLTVEDLAKIYQMDELGEKEGNDRDFDGHLEWAEEEEHTVGRFSASEGKKIEQHVSMSAFLNGRLG